MRYIFIAILVSIIALIPFSTPQQPATHAQGDDSAACTAFTDAAIQRTRQFCSRVNRDFACYGNDSVKAAARATVANFQFDHPGDISNVTSFDSIQLSGMNESLEEWGVVMMKLRANIPQASPQAVSMVLFGSVSLENAGFASEPVAVTLDKHFSLDVREEPKYGADIVYNGELGDELLAHEQSADGSWLYVEVPGTRQMGWVRTSGVSSEGDLTALSEHNGKTLYQPMQAVYLSDNDSGDGTCNAFPTNGMLVQTPEGIAEVTLLVNEVTIELGSTALIEVSHPLQMTFSLLEGHSSVTSRGVTVEVPAGFSTTIRLDLNGRASSAPSAIRPYDPAIDAIWNQGPGSLVDVRNDEPDDTGSGENGKNSVAICHVPPGNPANAHTITVDGDSMEDHLGHGDYQGACIAIIPPADENNNQQNTNNGSTTAIEEDNGQGQSENQGNGNGNGNGNGQGKGKDK